MTLSSDRAIAVLHRVVVNAAFLTHRVDRNHVRVNSSTNDGGLSVRESPGSISPWPRVEITTSSSEPPSTSTRANDSSYTWCSPVKKELLASQ